jgi:hypothetical protein
MLLCTELASNTQLLADNLPLLVHYVAMHHTVTQ